MDHVTPEDRKALLDFARELGVRLKVDEHGLGPDGHYCLYALKDARGMHVPVPMALTGAPWTETDLADVLDAYQTMGIMHEVGHAGGRADEAGVAEVVHKVHQAMAAFFDEDALDRLLNEIGSAADKRVALSPPDAGPRP